ncbi:hypothetical protein EDD11_001122 [Mortierella claussenii]|nr:hypothetical protein EDD11_001122 [Mortierella claussenii]
MHVIIVGAGIGGLMLGILLERAGISYEILEKTIDLRPLGSALIISALGHLFKQLDMEEELNQIAKPFGALRLRKQNMNVAGAYLTRSPGIDTEQRYGEYASAVARPDLAKLLMSRIPKEKIHFGKRVVSTSQTKEEVIVECSDNSTFTGSILVGADGTYSNVRKNMYKELKREGRLPECDDAPLTCGYDCVVGVTDPVDPEEYPIVNNKFTEMEIMLGKEIPYTWLFIPLAGNRIGWKVVRDRRKQRKEEMAKKDSEWRADAAQEIINRVRHLPCPYGGTFGDIVDKTNPNAISQVMLEEKMMPFGGMGANMAIVSAIKLANLIVDVEHDTQPEITRIFKEYYESRKKPCRAAVNGSSQSTLMMHTKGVMGDLLRHVSLNWVPKWIYRKISDALNVNRIQASFLPFVPFQGDFKKTKPTPPARKVAYAASRVDSKCLVQ